MTSAQQKCKGLGVRKVSTEWVIRRLGFLAEITAIRESSAAQENLGKAAELMSGFYQRSDHWIRYADHNHLRVSRITRSLALLPGKDTAKQFLARIGGESCDG